MWQDIEIVGDRLDDEAEAIRKFREMETEQNDSDLEDFEIDNWDVNDYEYLENDILPYDTGDPVEPVIL